MIWVHAGGLSRFRDLQELYRAAHDAPVPLFIGLYVLAALISFPTFLLSIVAGGLYGIGWGTAWVWVGANLGAWGGYGVGRLLGEDLWRRWVEKFAALGRFQEGLSRHALLFVLQVRFLPIVPFALSNFAFGAFRCPFWKFAIGTAVGLIPYTLIYTYFGSSLQNALESGPSGPGVQFFHLWVSLVLVVAVTLVSFWVARRRNREGLPPA
jgi:uncharacterized membrane protein YdjX (TVP38/TMEM64 family)